MAIKSLEAPVGFRREDIWIGALTAITVMVAATAYGALPPYMAYYQEIDLFQVDDPLGSYLVMGFVVLFASLTIGYFGATRLVQHRWLWPFGPRLVGPKPMRRYRVMTVVVLLIANVVSRLVIDGLPRASGFYGSDAGDVVLRVVAPADSAMAMVVFMAVTVVAYVVGLASVAVWGWARPHAASVASS